MAEKKTKKKKEYVTVDCQLLNVRLNPDINSARLAQVTAGTKLEKVGTVGAWYKIKTKIEEVTVTGYVMAEYVV